MQNPIQKVQNKRKRTVVKNKRRNGLLKKVSWFLFKNGLLNAQKYKKAIFENLIKKTNSNFTLLI